MFWKIKSWYLKLSNKRYYFKMKHKYPDYIEDEYNYGDLKFIWGIKSWDDLNSKDANLYTMNDLDIIYDRDKKEYILGIETIYSFDNGNKGEIRYLEGLLDKFTKYMHENEYTTTQDKLCLTCVESSEPWRAETISELYIRFKIFVNGYKSVFEE